MFFFKLHIYEYINMYNSTYKYLYLLPISWLLYYIIYKSGYKLM